MTSRSSAQVPITASNSASLQEFLDNVLLFDQLYSSSGMSSASVSQLQGRATSHEERSKRKRMHSPAAGDRTSNSEELEAGEALERRPFDGSMSISDRAHRNGDLTSNVNANASPQNVEPGIENRFANVERMLTTQQELLQKLVSAQEPPPPLLPTLSEIYERAREEAQFVDFHHWDSLYMHGLVRIDGEICCSTMKDPPCEPCEAYNRVCIVLAEEDPYREFLFVERKWTQSAKPRDLPSRTSREPFFWPHEPSEENERETPGREGCQRLTEFFINGDRIEWEVISEDISRYLGNDAVVRPGIYKSTKSSEVISGFYVTAYRAPTDAMLSDLRADSALWQAEKESHKSNKQQIPRNAQDEGFSPATESTRPQDNYEPAEGYSYLAGRGGQDYGYGRGARDLDY